MLRGYSGQVYEFVGREPYLTKDGREIALYVWRSRCASCGEYFEVKTSTAAARTFANVNRRCEMHRKALRRVKGECWAIDEERPQTFEGMFG